jgi:glycosyltransferase involved in cell wall biosynthesis
MYYAYKGIDLVVIPTVASEGTSLSAIESISCGIPIITTDVGGLNDICIDGVNGLKIRANDYENLLQAVEYAYLNREEVKEWGEGALLISKAFDKKKWDASWIAIIDAFRKEISK